MLASGLTTTIPPTITPAPPACWSIKIAGAESANSAGEGLGSNNTSPDVTNESMVNDNLPIPIHGRGGTTQYQLSTDDDDAGSDLPLSHQEGGFTSHYHSPQRTAGELPSVEDTSVLGRQDKIQQLMPPVHISPDILPPGEVYVPFPPSAGKSSNTYYPCPGRMFEQDQVQPIPGFNTKTQKQVLCTIWRPTMKTFQVILETIPHVTLTQAKSKHWMSYCLEQIVDCDRQRLHFAPKTALMCHVHHYQIMQQARLMASHPCQPDDWTVVSPTEGGLCQLAGIQVGSGQGDGIIDDPTSDVNSSDPDAQIILPHADRKLPESPFPVSHPR
jgi:hypothetical protein